MLRFSHSIFFRFSYSIFFFWDVENSTVIYRAASDNPLIKGSCWGRSEGLGR